MARVLPVSSVAAQGKELAPKTRRTMGMRRTINRTDKGRAKKATWRITSVKVLVNCFFSESEFWRERVGRAAWPRVTPKREEGRIYSRRATLNIDKDPAAKSEARITVTKCSI